MHKRLKNLFNKKINLKSLCCSTEELHKRLELINYISNINSNMCTARTRVFINEDVIEYEQEFISKQSTKKIKELKPYLYELANTLESFLQNNFIHGDLVKRNILFNGTNYKIIDFEPCLCRINRLNNEVMTFTPPYISEVDLFDKKLSYRTDKISFFFFILKETNNLEAEKLSELFNLRMRQNKNILPISEDRFVLMNYYEIIEFAYEYMKILKRINL